MNKERLKATFIKELQKNIESKDFQLPLDFTENGINPSKKKIDFFNDNLKIGSKEYEQHAYKIKQELLFKMNLLNFKKAIKDNDNILFNEYLNMFETEFKNNTQEKLNDIIDNGIPIAIKNGNVQALDKLLKLKPVVDVIEYIKLIATACEYNDKTTLYLIDEYIIKDKEKEQIQELKNYLTRFKTIAFIKENYKIVDECTRYAKNNNIEIRQDLLLKTAISFEFFSGVEYLLKEVGYDPRKESDYQTIEFQNIRENIFIQKLLEIIDYDNMLPSKKGIVKTKSKI